MTEAVTINGILAKLTVGERTRLTEYIDKAIAEAFNDGINAAAYKIRDQINKEFSL